MLFLPRSQYYDSVKNVKTTWHSSQSEQDQGLECNAKANTHGEQECLATRKNDVNQEGWDVLNTSKQLNQLFSLGKE